jgi:hypothetical protein
MISAEKVMNIKVVELIKIYNFYFDHFFIQQSGSNIAHKIYISLQWFHNYKVAFGRVREMGRDSKRWVWDRNIRLQTHSLVWHEVVKG